MSYYNAMRVLPRRMALYRDRISLLLTHEQRPSTNDILLTLLDRCVGRLMGRSPFNGGGGGAGLGSETRPYWAAAANKQASSLARLPASHSHSTADLAPRAAREMKRVCLGGQNGPKKQKTRCDA